VSVKLLNRTDLSTHFIGAHLLLLQALLCEFDESGGKVKFLAAGVCEVAKALAHNGENA
jgi:hypothetical protein